MKRIPYLIILFGYFYHFQNFAQDVQSSHFNANSVFHNPAFTGSTALTRLSVNHRSQWMSLGNFAAYNTQTLNFDTYSERLSSGFGVQIVHDTQGTGFRSFEGSLSYSFNAPLSFGSTDRIKGLWFGLQSTVRNRRMNGDNLNFVYQYNSNGLDNTIPVINSSGNGSFNDLNLGYSGGIVYASRHKYDINEPSFVLGAALHHLEGFSYTKKEAPPMGYVKYTFHGSFMIPLNVTRGMVEQNLVTTAYYRRQGANRQLDFGFNWVRSPMMVGLWYRGQFNQKNSDALYVLMGVQGSNWRLTGSYDLPVGSLQNRGSFEITLGFILSSGFDFGTHSSKADATKCTTYGYYWLF